MEARQNYLGVSGAALHRALRMDAARDEAPGRLFKTLASVIGGIEAEPWSHIKATTDCQTRIWLDDGLIQSCRPATSIVLRNLIKHREDFRQMIAAMVERLPSDPEMLEYVRSWARGHFVI